MKKFTLYDEYCNIDIYGADFAEAVHRHKEFRRSPKIIDGKPVPVPPLVVKRTVGYEDTSSTTRGNDRFLRVVVETADCKYVAIDGRQTGNIAEFPACRKIETNEMAA